MPIIFLEPSCFSMFAEDYRELKIPGAEKIATRCFLFESFVENLLAAEPDALQFRNGRFPDQPINVAIHAHCHAKSLLKPDFMPRLVERMPGRKAVLLETGCCGMAGAFGALASKYDLSLLVAQPLIDKIQGQPAHTEVIASGTSCRHQIADLTAVRPRHMAELIADAIDDSGGSDGASEH
jgi:Fe-S oxidoreductase